MAKTNLLPALAIGGIAVAAIAMGGKKKKNRGRVSESRIINNKQAPHVTQVNVNGLPDSGPDVERINELYFRVPQVQVSIRSNTKFADEVSALMMSADDVPFLILIDDTPGATEIIDRILVTERSGAEEVSYEEFGNISDPAAMAEAIEYARGVVSDGEARAPSDALVVSYRNMENAYTLNRDAFMSDTKGSLQALMMWMQANVPHVVVTEVTSGVLPAPALEAVAANGDVKFMVLPPDGELNRPGEVKLITSSQQRPVVVGNVSDPNTIDEAAEKIRELRGE